MKDDGGVYSPGSIHIKKETRATNHTPADKCVTFFSCETKSSSLAGGGQMQENHPGLFLAR